MKQPFLKITCLLTVLFLSASLTYAQNDWEVSLEKDAIRIYTREVANSKFKEYKGETLVKSSLSSLVSVLNDVSNQKNWFYNCAEAKRLETTSKTEGYNYFVQTAPWPVTDRDLIVKYALTQNPKTKVITIDLTGVKDFIPVMPDKVRVPSLKGQWVFTPLGKGIIKIVYQVHSDTGGSVPAAIANASCIDIPYNTLLNMKKEIEKPKYKNAVIDGILEP